MCYIDRKGIDNPYGPKQRGNTVILVGPPPQYLPPGYNPPPNDDHNNFQIPPPPGFYGGAPGGGAIYPPMSMPPSQPYNYVPIGEPQPPHEQINGKVEEQYNYTFDSNIA